MMIDQPTEPRLVTGRALADVLDVAPSTINRMARDGLLPVYRLGDRPQQWRYDVAECLRRLRTDHAGQRQGGAA